MCRICVALVQQSESGAARVIGHRCACEENGAGRVECEGARHDEERQLAPNASSTPVQTNFTHQITVASAR
jgi:hypothetical protein